MDNVYAKQQNQIYRFTSILPKEMIFKISFKSQTHLFNKPIYLRSLIQYSQKVFKDLPDTFTFVYLSPQGQMTYIENDADLIGLKYCCSSSNDFIVKLTIFKTEPIRQIQIDEDIEIINIVRRNLQEIQQNVFINIEEEINQEAVSEYLSFTYENVAKTVIQDENRLISSEVRDYLSELYEQTSKRQAAAEESFVLEKSQRKKIVRFSPQKPVIHHSYRPEKNIDDLINERVLSIIPSIVDKIYQKMQQKLQNRCTNCFKKQLQVQRCIQNEIERRLNRRFLSQENPQCYQ